MSSTPSGRARVRNVQLSSPRRRLDHREVRAREDRLDLGGHHRLQRRLVRLRHPAHAHAVQPLPVAIDQRHRRTARLGPRMPSPRRARPPPRGPRRDTVASTRTIAPMQEVLLLAAPVRRLAGLRDQPRPGRRAARTPRRPCAGSAAYNTGGSWAQRQARRSSRRRGGTWRACTGFAMFARTEPAFLPSCRRAAGGRPAILPSPPVAFLQGVAPPSNCHRCGRRLRDLMSASYTRRLPAGEHFAIFLFGEPPGGRCGRRRDCAPPRLHPLRVLLGRGARAKTPRHR